MANLTTRRPSPEGADQNDPRKRASAATQAFAAIYLGALIFLVLIQFSMGEPDEVPVLQRFVPSKFGALEILLGVGSGLLVVLAEMALRPKFKWLKAFDETIHGIVGKPTAIQCTILALTSSLTEEVAFRGILQSSVGIVIASILFGMAHYFMWQWAVFAALMGLLFGGLYELTDGGLVAPVLSHFTINMLGLLYLSKHCPEDAPPYQPTPPKQSAESPAED